MYRTRQIRIKRGHRFYPYCREICYASARLYNRGTYLIRQYATAEERMEKGERLEAGQREAYEMIRRITEGTKYCPKKKWLTYGQLDYILKSTEDAAYRAVPSQANQQILKVVFRIGKRPEAFTGRPRMPGYKKKDSLATAVLTNQICTVKEGRYLKLPGIADRLNIGKQGPGTKLKEVRIKPHTDSFTIDIVMETGEEGKTGMENPLLCMDVESLAGHLSGLEENPYRTASIDPGTENFCAVTNNFGERPFLVKGGVIRSENAYYNRKLAQYRSEAQKCNGRYETKRMGRLHERRNRIIKDRMHKISRRITDWAEANRVQLVILGHNVYQKQGISLGHKNNQNFVQIPFQVFAGMLRYKLGEKGIAFLETEEAYTSQADYLEQDPIPKYEKGKQKPEMSGKRTNRGEYRHKNGKISNADINGAANIMRKVFPNIKEWDRGLVDRPYAVKIA